MPAFPAEIEQWRPLVQRYFPQSEVDRALWVIWHESGGNPGIASRFNAGGGEDSHGLWQINLDAHPQMRGRTNDPEAATAYAAQLWSSQGWRPWSVTHQGFPADLQGSTAAATVGSGNITPPATGAGGLTMTMLNNERGAGPEGTNALPPGTASGAGTALANINPGELPEGARILGGNLAEWTDPTTGVTYSFQYNPTERVDLTTGEIIPSGWNPRGTPKQPGSEGGSAPTVRRDQNGNAFEWDGQQWVPAPQWNETPGSQSGAAPTVRYDASGNAYEWNGSAWVPSPMWNKPDEAAQSAGAFSESQLQAAGAQPVAPGVYVFNGAQYRQNPDGSFSLYGQLMDTSSTTGSGNRRFDEFLSNAQALTGAVRQQPMVDPNSLTMDSMTSGQSYGMQPTNVPQNSAQEPGVFGEDFFYQGDIKGSPGQGATGATFSADPNSGKPSLSTIHMALPGGGTLMARPEQLIEPTLAQVGLPPRGDVAADLEQAMDIMGMRKIMGEMNPDLSPTEIQGLFFDPIANLQSNSDKNRALSRDLYENWSPTELLGFAQGGSAMTGFSGYDDPLHPYASLYDYAGLTNKQPTQYTPEGQAIGNFDTIKPQNTSIGNASGSTAFNTVGRPGIQSALSKGYTSAGEFRNYGGEMLPVYDATSSLYNPNTHAGQYLRQMNKPNYTTTTIGGQPAYLRSYGPSLQNPRQSGSRGNFFGTAGGIGNEIFDWLFGLGSGEASQIEEFMGTLDDDFALRQLTTAERQRIFRDLQKFLEQGGRDDKTAFYDSSESYTPFPGYGNSPGLAQGGTVMIDEPIIGVGQLSGEEKFQMGEMNGLTGQPTKEIMQVTPLEPSVPMDMGPPPTPFATFMQDMLTALPGGTKKKSGRTPPLVPAGMASVA